MQNSQTFKHTNILTQASLFKCILLKSYWMAMHIMYERNSMLLQTRMVLENFLAQHNFEELLSINYDTMSQASHSDNQWGSSVISASSTFSIDCSQMTDSQLSCWCVQLSRWTPIFEPIRYTRTGSGWGKTFVLLESYTYACNSKRNWALYSHTMCKK